MRYRITSHLLIIAALMSYSTVSNANPLDENCQPNTLTDKARAVAFTERFWTGKIEELRAFKANREKELRLAPLEYQREIQQMQYRFRRDRIELPEMYQGDLRVLTLQSERDEMAATQQLYRELPIINRRWIAWAEKCIAYAEMERYR